MNTLARSRVSLDPRVARWLLAGVAAAAGMALMRVWTPSDDPATTLCMARRDFGVPCLTCGMTRAFAALARGEWARAIALHPLAPLLAAELAAAWALWGVTLARGAWPLPRRVTVAALGGTFALFAIVWVVRLATGTLPG